MLEEFYYISALEPTTHFRHGRRAATVFADGHAESLRPEDGSLDSRLPKDSVGRLEERYLKEIR